VILFSNNYQRFKLDAEALAEFEVQDLSRKTLPEDFRRNPKIHVAYLLRRRNAGVALDAGPAGRSIRSRQD